VFRGHNGWRGHRFGGGAFGRPGPGDRRRRRRAGRGGQHHRAERPAAAVAEANRDGLPSGSIDARRAAAPASRRAFRTEERRAPAVAGPGPVL
jgi:hypothetical protein